MQNISKSNHLDNLNMKKTKVIRIGLWFVFEGLGIAWFFYKFYKMTWKWKDALNYALYSTLMLLAIVSTIIGMALCMKFLSQTKWRRILYDSIYIFSSVIYLPIAFCFTIVLFRYDDGFALLFAFVCMLSNFPIAFWVNKHLDLNESMKNRFFSYWFALPNLILFCYIQIISIPAIPQLLWYSFFSITTLLMTTCGFCMLFKKNKYDFQFKQVVKWTSIALMLWNVMRGEIIIPSILFYIIYNLYAVFHLHIKSKYVYSAS